MFENRKREYERLVGLERFADIDQGLLDEFNDGKVPKKKLKKGSKDDGD